MFRTRGPISGCRCRLPWYPDVFSGKGPVLLDLFRNLVSLGVETGCSVLDRTGEAGRRTYSIALSASILLTVFLAAIDVVLYNPVTDERTESEREWLLPSTGDELPGGQQRLRFASEELEREGYSIRTSDDSINGPTPPLPRVGQGLLLGTAAKKWNMGGQWNMTSRPRMARQLPDNVNTFVSAKLEGQFWFDGPRKAATIWLASTAEDDDDCMATRLWCGLQLDSEFMSAPTLNSSRDSFEFQYQPEDNSVTRAPFRRHSHENAVRCGEV
ncbi:hypothetical protein FB451DRAFT_1185154 [Mycena latifolia]|nr:hypothetical protein FB451DRAFT_1185154 [Mycena latifolia]